jgi:hypothetical protein
MKIGTQYFIWFPTFVGTTSGFRIKSGMTFLEELIRRKKYGRHRMQLCKVCGGGKDLQAGKGKRAFLLSYKDRGANTDRSFGKVC